jgi:hypothetical protein
MKVDRVTATIRFSQDSGKGAWKSVEVGAEATLAPTEDWRIAQEQLYHELGQQIKTLWTSGNGSGKPQDGSEKPVKTAPKQPEPQSLITSATSIRPHFGATKRMAGSGIATRRGTIGAMKH